MRMEGGVDGWDWEMEWNAEVTEGSEVMSHECVVMLVGVGVPKVVDRTSDTRDDSKGA